MCAGRATHQSTSNGEKAYLELIFIISFPVVLALHFLIFYFPLRSYYQEGLRVLIVKN